MTGSLYNGAIGWGRVADGASNLMSRDDGVRDCIEMVRCVPYVRSRECVDRPSFSCVLAFSLREAGRGDWRHLRIHPEVPVKDNN